MADRREAPRIVRRQGDSKGEHRSGDRADPGPLVATADTEPRQEDHGEPNCRDESRDRNVEVADVVIQVGVEGLDLVLPVRHLALADPELEETVGEVTDEEDDPVADEPEAGEAHQPRAPTESCRLA